MQRLHPDDLASHLLGLERWDEVIMPAIATEREEWDLGHGRIKVREPGDLLQEFHVGRAELDLNIVTRPIYSERQTMPQGGRDIRVLR